MAKPKLMLLCYCFAQILVVATSGDPLHKVLILVSYSTAELAGLVFQFEMGNVTCSVALVSHFFRGVTVETRHVFPQSVL